MTVGVGGVIRGVVNEEVDVRTLEVWRCRCESGGIKKLTH